MDDYMTLMLKDSWFKVADYVPAATLIKEAGENLQTRRVGGAQNFRRVLKGRAKNFRRFIISDSLGAK